MWDRKPTTQRYSPEEKERAVRMVLQLREELGTKQGTVKRVADQLGIGVESLRSLGETGTRSITVTVPGTTTAEAARIKELEQEIHELRRANSILKSASAFSRRSSTAHRSDRRLHRRSPPGVRSRADLCRSSPRPAPRSLRPPTTPASPGRRRPVRHR